jgi:ABC-2 type transport system ATP-binding protein
MDIELAGLTKRYGTVTAVRDLTARVTSGQVTAFLGPNGAGKTTTVRMLLGLIRPDAGRALIDGHPYRSLPSPRRAVGAVLGPDGFHPGRSGRDHLRIVARQSRLDPRRVDDVLETVELSADADRRVGGYSLGMRQRLGLAGALLGDPQVIIADEPANGLDPEGIAWLRRLLREAAAEGRTVLISSHFLAEVTRTADRVLVVHRGTLRFDGSLAELAGTPSSTAPDAAALEAAFLRLTSDAEPSASRTSADASRASADASRTSEDGRSSDDGRSSETVPGAVA